MLALDDAQFADRSSLQCIAYLAARCQELAGAAGAHDPHRRGRRQATSCWRRCAADAGDDVLTPRALSAGRGRGRWCASASARTPTPEFCEACARVTSAGNPFLLGELLTELAAEQLTATAANVAYVEQANPDSVRRAVLGRLERLGPDAAALAQAVAVLEHATLREAAELARLEIAARRSPPPTICWRRDPHAPSRSRSCTRCCGWLCTSRSHRPSARGPPPRRADAGGGRRVDHGRSARICCGPRPAATDKVVQLLSAASARGDRRRRPERRDHAAAPGARRAARGVGCAASCSASSARWRRSPTIPPRSSTSPRRWR